MTKDEHTAFSWTPKPGASTVDIPSRDTRVFDIFYFSIPGTESARLPFDDVLPKNDHTFYRSPLCGVDRFSVETDDGRNISLRTATSASTTPSATRRAVSVASGQVDAFRRGGGSDYDSMVQGFQHNIRHR